MKRMHVHKGPGTTAIGDVCVSGTALYDNESDDDDDWSLC